MSPFYFSYGYFFFVEVLGENLWDQQVGYFIKTRSFADFRSKAFSDFLFDSAYSLHSYRKAVLV